VIMQSKILSNAITPNFPAAFFVHVVAQRKLTVHSFGSGAHLSTYSVGTGGDFPGG
jgi:hypothetical protein